MFAVKNNMNKDSYDEFLLYATAVESLLLRKQLAPVRCAEENKLIERMLHAKLHYTDCVRAIINHRIKDKIFIAPEF